MATTAFVNAIASCSMPISSSNSVDVTVELGLADGQAVAWRKRVMEAVVW
jgi:hypothetical protein